MADLLPQAHDVLARQHGVASIDELIAAGMSEWAILDVVRRGGLELVLPGAYRTPSVGESERQRCVAVCRAHPELVIAGPTAAKLLGLRRVLHSDSVHVHAPPASNPTVRRWVEPFRTSTFVDADIVEREDGIRILSLPRLALDLARFVGDLDLMSIAEQCMLDGPHTHAEMIAVAVDWMSPRRRWVRRYLEAMARRVQGPPAESHLEVIVGDRLKAAIVTGLVRQYWVRPDAHPPIRFDLAVPAKRCARVALTSHPRMSGPFSDET